MTAAEMIAELQKCPGDTEVHFMMSEGCCGEVLVLEATDIDAHLSYGKWFTSVRFAAMQGFRSCRKAAATLKFMREIDPDPVVPTPDGEAKLGEGEET